MRPESHDVTLRDDDGRVKTLVTITPMDGDGEQAKAIGELIRDAQRGETSETSTPEYSMLRLAVNGDLLDVENPIDYLVALLLEGKRYDGNWDGDEEQVAQWAVAQWCQETRWVPDLRDYDAGEQVERGDDIACLDTAFYTQAQNCEEGDDV